MTYNELLNLIESGIVPGVPKGITAEKLNSILTELTKFTHETKGDYQGPAIPSDDPGTPSSPVFYTATTAGIYTKFGGKEVTQLQIESGWVHLSYISGSWRVDVISIPKPENKINSWLPQIYAKNNQVVKGGVIWEANSNTVATDIPGVSSKWNEKIEPVNIQDSTSKNLFKKSNLVFGKYINGSGVVTNLDGASMITVPIDMLTGHLFLEIPESNGSVSRRAIFTDNSGGIIGSVLNFFASPTIMESIEIPSGSKNFAITIDSPSNTFRVNYDSIKIINSKEREDVFIDQINGVKIQASSLSHTNEVKEFLLSESLIVKSSSENLLDYSIAHLNSTYSSEGFIYSASYHCSDYIPVQEGETYVFTDKNGRDKPVRAIRTFDIYMNQLVYLTAGYNILTAAPNTAYIVVIFYNTIPINELSVVKGNTNVFIPYTGNQHTFSDNTGNATLPTSITRVSDVRRIISEEASPEITGKVKVTISNSDKILYTGSSSVEGFYLPDRKVWLNKLQDFLDYIVVPYGWSGNGAIAIADKLISDTPTQSGNSVKPSEINPTYVFVGQTLNMGTEISQATDQSFVEANDKLMNVAISATGGKLIVGTAYRTESRPWIENSLKKLADKYDADFIPFGSYHSSMIRNNKYTGFYGQGHPGIRTSESYTLPLLSYFEQFRRPKQSILIFEARNDSETVANLIVRNNNERAQKFRSIQVGEVVLQSSSQARYDSLDPYDYTIGKVNTSDYMKLLKKQNVPLKNKSLIEFIIPKVNIDNAVITLTSTGISASYLYNNFTESWDLFSIVDSKITFSSKKYFSYDKVKLLIVGTSIVLTDLNIEISGGVEKPVSFAKLQPSKAGKTLFSSDGFDSTTVSKWELRTNIRYNQTIKYGAEFYDIPKYLGDSKDVLVLTDLLTAELSLLDIESFGYQTLRVWICARLNPKIYDPDEFASWSGGADNPFTDVSWYGEDKFDYDYMSVVMRYKGVTYENQARSINSQRVGLFWNLGYVDIILPIARDGTYELRIERQTNNNAYPMELCDVSIELL